MTPAPRWAHGVVVGKFLPLHAGHLHLIQEAATQVDTLTVLACSLPTEPIPGSVRVRWLQECCAALPEVGPRIRIAPVTELVPQAPEEHPSFWVIWAALVRRHAPGIDVLFSSEAYGEPFAAALGVPHVAVDPPRRKVPCSGTMARTNPYAVWNHLPAPVRAANAFRIAVVGPESTGKTTLAAALATHLGTTWVAEYGREYTAGRDAHDLDDTDLARIMVTQVAHETAAARQAQRILVCDTDPMTTATWSDLLLGRATPEIDIISRLHTYPLTILCGGDVPWHQDGTRAHGAERAKHRALLEAALARHERHWVEVSGSVAERVSQAVAAIAETEPRLRPFLPVARSWRPLKPEASLVGKASGSTLS